MLSSIKRQTMHLMARDLACVQFERQHPRQLVHVFGAAARATTRRACAPWRPICSMTCRPWWQRASKTVAFEQATRAHWPTRTGPWSTAWRCCKAGTYWASRLAQMPIREPTPMPTLSSRTAGTHQARKALKVLVQGLLPDEAS